MAFVFANVPTNFEAPLNQDILNQSQNYGYDLQVYGWYGNKFWFGTQDMGQGIDVSLEAYNTGLPDEYVNEVTFFGSGGIMLAYTDIYVPTQSYSYAYNAGLPFSATGVFAGDDKFGGSYGSDIIFGHEGSDSIFGEGGDDFLWGGVGSDYVFGGAGSNTFFSEVDNSIDRLYVSPDGLPDVIYGIDLQDKILIEDRSDYDLSVMPIVGGIAIFANDIHEATYVGGNLTPSQLLDCLWGVNN